MAVAGAACVPHPAETVCREAHVMSTQSTVKRLIISRDGDEVTNLEKKIPAQTPKKTSPSLVRGSSRQRRAAPGKELAHASDVYEPHHTIGNDSADEFAREFATTPP
jgi:hypothetical protein